MARIAAPRPSLSPLFFSAVCIGVAGFLPQPPEGLDLASIAYLLSSFLALKVGLIRIYVAVSGVPLRPVYAQLWTHVVAAACIAAFLLAPPPGRHQPVGTPAPVHDLATCHPKPLFMYNLSLVGDPEVAENTVVRHLESLIVNHASSGSLVEAVPDRVTGSTMHSFDDNALIGNTEATDDLLAVCPVPSSLPNILLLDLFCELGNRGERFEEVI